MPFYRYGRWDGTQEVPDLSAEELVDRVADEMLETGDLRRVLRRMMQFGTDFPGGQRMQGLRDLLERLQQRRDQNLEQYNLDSMMDDIQEKLDQIIDRERQTVEDALKDAPQGQEDAPRNEGSGEGPEGEEDSSQEGGQGRNADGAGEVDPDLLQLRQRLAQQHMEQLDKLPPGTGGRVKGLQQYDFMDPQARQEFEELLQMLQQQMMQSYFQGLQQGVENMTPEAMQQVREMVQDLNRLMQQRMSGQEPDFQQFMDKWGKLFPEGIENLDDLIEHMNRQMAQMESLLNSMSPEQRRQLEEMVGALMQDEGMQWDMAQLAANLQRLSPQPWFGNDFDFGGDEPISLQEAMRLMGDMNSMDDLEHQVMDSIRHNDAASLDNDEVRRLLGDESAQILEQLQEFTKRLEEAGFIQRKGDSWELTPQAVRKMGQRALEEIFGKLQMSVFGSHDARRTGIGIEMEDSTKPYEFGDPFHMDTQKTVFNAVTRQGRGTPVKINHDDFEVSRTEALTRAATVIMLDMSRSMMMNGCFQAGRKVTSALDSLIRMQYPRDSLYVLAFSYFVLGLKPEMIFDNSWIENGGGTNFQEAMFQARRVLSKHRAETKQIVIITDGQPTTYNYWWSERDFDRPGLDGLQETLREAMRCAREGITINTFMLSRDPYSADFVRMLTKVSRGRAFFATPDRLGEYVLHDYVMNKRKVEKGQL